MKSYLARAATVGCWCSAANSRGLAWSRACEPRWPKSRPRLRSKTRCCRCATGPAIGQASDGALIVASDAARLRAALRGGETYPEARPAARGGRGLRPAREHTGAAWLRPVRAALGSLVLGEHLDADVAVYLRPGASAEPGGIARAFATLGASAPLASAGPPPAGTRGNSASSGGRGEREAELDRPRVGGWGGVAVGAAHDPVCAPDRHALNSPTLGWWTCPVTNQATVPGLCV